MNGEKINDAVYKRNLLVEKNLNCTIKEFNVGDYDADTTEMSKMVQTMVASNETTYDAVYMYMNMTAAGIAEGYYRDLREISTMHFNESWWDDVMMDATSIKNHNYFASSSAHLMGWELLWCLYFNDKMMDDLGLERPYQLVRDGKWTLDELEKYCKAAANLNGDDKFTSREDANCVAGCVSFWNCMPKFIFGCNALYVTKNKDDVPVFDCGEKFINACQKIADYTTQDGCYIGMTGGNYLNVFKQERALFAGGEIKTAQQMRDLEWNFGLVPFPKYDAAQEKYLSTPAHQSAVLTIPVTTPDADEVGLLFDALSYESDKSVITPYFEYMVEQKGLRNDDSIEMLQIIKSGRSFDIGIAFQWAAPINDVFKNKLNSSSLNIVSTIDSKKAAVEGEIQKTLDAIE